MSDEPTNKQRAAWALYAANAVILGSAVERDQIDAAAALTRFESFASHVDDGELRDAALEALRAWARNP